MTRGVSSLVALAPLSVVLACGGRVYAPGDSSGPGGGPGTRDGGVTAGRGGVETTADASAPRHTDTPLPPGFPAASRTLSSLDGKERRALCLEDARRADTCLTEGMAKQTKSDCVATAAECRKSIDPSRAAADCDSPRQLTDCDVTVTQFLRCVDAWNENVTCDNAGLQIDTPEACKAVSDCTDFRFAFQQFGRPPRCDPRSMPPPPPDTDDDLYGATRCFPVPKRFVTLGNSIGECGGSTGCAQEELHAYLESRYAPGLTYEKHTANGGDFDDLARQMKLVDGGPGHVAVWIYSFPAKPDDAAFDLWKAELDSVIDYFSDASRFTDGASFLLNTQYSPSDQCPAPPGPDPGFLTLDQEALLRKANQTLFIDLAGARSDTVTVDQYPDWLGHGWNAGAKGCPHCLVDSTLWQRDPLHPNAAGQEHMFEKWKVAVDRIYGSACK